MSSCVGEKTCDDPPEEELVFRHPLCKARLRVMDYWTGRLGQEVVREGSGKKEVGCKWREGSEVGRLGK